MKTSNNQAENPAILTIKYWEPILIGLIYNFVEQIETHLSDMPTWHFPCYDLQLVSNTFLPQYID